ncbi:MAG: lysylphosphatidylglycerol synthase transmembrane domain-containing protein [Vicinamibacterales bacterium]
MSTLSDPRLSPVRVDGGPPATGARSWLRHVLLLAKLGLSVGLMAFVLRGTSLEALWRTFRQVRPGWIVAAMSMHGLMVAVSVWRWRLLLDAQQIRVSVRTLAESFWVALFFNNFLPSNIGGDVVRIADTAKPAGSKTLATTVILVDRVLGLLALLSVGAIGAMGARSLGVDIPGTFWIEVGALSALGLCVLLFFAPGLRNLAFRPLRALALGHPWVTERVTLLQDTLDRFGRRPSALAGALAGAVLVQGVIVAFYALTARSLAISLPLVMAGVLVPVALVLQMAPVSVNGFGVREAVFSFFFVRFGLGVEAAVAVSLLGTALIMLFSLGGGALFLLRRH